MLSQQSRRKYFLTTSEHDCQGIKISGRAAVGDESTLDQLIGAKVGSVTGTIAQQSGASATKDGRKTTLLVQNTSNSDRSIVLLGCA